MRADADLPWYFGSGASTAQGDAGLRSPLGAQLDVLASGILPAERAVDASQAEEMMHDRMNVGQRLRRIEAVLRQLNGEQVQVLRLHYTGSTLPFGVDPAFAMIARSEEGLRQLLLDLPTVEVVRLRYMVDCAVREAQAAYDRAAKHRQIGDRVRTVKPFRESDDWTPEAHLVRRWGVRGTILNTSDSHGLIYQVGHDKGGAAWYEPRELESL